MLYVYGIPIISFWLKKLEKVQENNTVSPYSEKSAIWGKTKKAQSTYIKI